MSWGTDDLYNQPEKFGLTQIGCIDDPEASYSFDYLVLWKHEDGRLFYAQDSGCSCPSPFEDFTKLEDATELTDAGWAEFQKEVEGHCLPMTWDAEKSEYVRDLRNDPNAADKTDMLRKAAELLRAQKVTTQLVGFVVMIKDGEPFIGKTIYAEVPK